MPCLYRCQALAADLALALPWLLSLPSWGKSGYLDHRRVDISGQPQALPGRGCHEVAMAGVTAVVLQVGIFWGSSGLALVLGIWHLRNSGDAAENRGLVLWSRIQGSECVVKIFRITSGKKRVHPELRGYGSAKGESVPLAQMGEESTAPGIPSHRNNPCK